MKLGNVGLIATAAVLAAMSVTAVLAENVSIVRQATELATTLNQSSGSERSEYLGTLQVFMIEKVSRWHDSQGNQYDNGLLDYAVIKPFSVLDGQVSSEIAIWNSAASGYGDLDPGNYGAVAVAFNSHGQVEDAYPPYGYYFDAYYADAAAAATPGLPGVNSVEGSYTHTVLVEEGTAEW